MHPRLVLHRPVNRRHNAAESRFSVAIMGFFGAVRIKPDHIDVATWRLGSSTVQSVPNRISDEPGRNPAVWETQMRHHFQEAPPDWIGAQDGIQLHIEAFIHA
jgi:hypothetical protein